MLQPHASFLSVLLLLIPHCAFAQSSAMPAKKAMSGHIREEGTAHGIPLARVDLLSSSGTPFATAYTDSNGAYEFDDIGGGDCYIVAQHDGFTTAREYVHPDGAPHTYKDVFLRVATKDSPSSSAPAVSQHELSIPRKARAEFEKGIQLVVTKSDYRAAVAQFARAVASFPTYYEAYAAMGLAQNRIGDPASAEKSLRKSVALSAEKYPPALLDLAALFNGQKRYAEADLLLHKVLQLDPSSWRGQFELAVALHGETQLRDAIASASAARDLKPSNPQTYLLLYNLHIQADDFASALQDADAYLKLAPDGATAERVRIMRAQVLGAVQASLLPLNTQNAPPAAAASADSEDSANLNDYPRLDESDTPQIPSDASQAESSKPETSESETSKGETTKQETVAAPASSRDAKTLPQPVADSLIPPRVDASVPEVSLNVPCHLAAVLEGAGRRAQQLLTSLQRFDASERVEHFRVNGSGVPGAADVRSFDYVVAVLQDSRGDFQLQEFRNGHLVSPRQFPSGIVTANLTAHALIFHPRLGPGFNFTCEGLGAWKDHPAWLVHFDEKPSPLGSFRSYDVDGKSYSLLLTGRAWIDAKTSQIVHLESDLLRPVPKIHLTREHISIEYAAVPFPKHREQLWLPQSADLYVEFDGRRFYRRHTFANFKLFSTETAQEIRAPNESYCFTNTSDRAVTGVLHATPLSGAAAKPASITIVVPANGTVCKSVGSGKDLNIPLASLGASTFAHNGPEGSIEADSYLLDGKSLEVVASGAGAPASQNP